MGARQIDNDYDVTMDKINESIRDIRKVWYSCSRCYGIWFLYMEAE